VIFKVHNFYQGQPLWLLMLGTKKPSYTTVLWQVTCMMLWNKYVFCMFSCLTEGQVFFGIFRLNLHFSSDKYVWCAKWIKSLKSEVSVNNTSTFSFHFTENILITSPNMIYFTYCSWMRSSWITYIEADVCIHAADKIWISVSLYLKRLSVI